jgi:2-oxoisovalerate dehydrogenase E1 component
VIESRGAYQTKSEIAITDGAEQVGLARLRRSGSHCAIITCGTMVQPSITAAEILAQTGIESSVLNLRWLSPIDHKAIIAAVTAANGNVLIVHEAVKSGGFAGEIGMRVHELCVNLAVRVNATPLPMCACRPLPHCRRRCCRMRIRLRML